MPSRFPSALLPLALLVACARTAPLPGPPPEVAPPLKFEKFGVVDPRNMPCETRPSVTVSGDSVVISGLFAESHAAPFQGMLMNERTSSQFLTLLIYTTQPGVLKMVSYDCYRARIAPLQPGSYILRVTHLRHPTVQREFQVETVLTSVITVPEPYPRGKRTQPVAP